MKLYALGLLAAAGLAQASDDKNIHVAIKRLAPSASIDSIRESGMPGVREVVVGGEVMYISDDGRFLLQGRLVDTQSRVDLTANTEKTLRADALKKFGPEKRLHFAAENPKHLVTIFTDVDCGYCRKLHQEIAEYNKAGISVDYLFFPRAGLNSASFDKAAFIWCAADPKETMNQSMSPAGIPYQPAKCDNPIGESWALAQRFAKTGTPTILANDGTFLGGYQSAQELLSRLAAR